MTAAWKKATLLFAVTSACLGGAYGRPTESAPNPPFPQSDERPGRPFADEGGPPQSKPFRVAQLIEGEAEWRAERKKRSELARQQAIEGRIQREQEAQQIRIRQELENADRDRIARIAEQRRLDEQRRRDEEAQRLAEQKRIEDERRVAEEARIAEQRHKDEEAQRLAEQRRLDDERRLAAQRLAEQKRLEDERKLAEQQRRKDEEAQRLAEQKRLEDEHKLAEQQRRKDEEAQRLAEQKRLEDERKLAEQQRRKDEEAQRLAEQKRLEDERKLAAQRLAEQKRTEEERKLAEQRRKEEEAQRLAEQKRLDDERKVAEQKRIEEERKLAEQRRKDEEAQRLAELKRLEDERKLAAQRLAEQKRTEEERKLAEQQRRKEEEAQRLAEQKRIEEERKLAEQRRRDDEAQRLAEQKRLDDERKVAEQKRLADAKLAPLQQQMAGAPGVSGLISDEVTQFTIEQRRLARDRLERERRIGPDEGTGDQSQALLDAQNANPTRLASIPPQTETPTLPPPVTAPSISQGDIRLAQVELKRLGCYNGPTDGRLTADMIAGLDTAERSLPHAVGRSLRPLSSGTLEFLKTQKEKLCTGRVACEPNQTKQGTTCIAALPPPSQEPTPRQRSRTADDEEDTPVRRQAPRQAAPVAPRPAPSAPRPAPVAPSGPKPAINLTM